jgi:hypothetical protein
MSATYTIPNWFSPAMCRAITNAYKEGYKVQEISRLFNIKYNQIYRFLVLSQHLTPTKKGKRNEDK